MLWDGKDIGAAGIISGSTNAFGAKAQAALQAHLPGPPAMPRWWRSKAARAMAGKYPLMPAMKQVEAWRSGDDSWTRMAPPLVELTAAQAADLRADLDALATQVAAE